MKTIHRIGAGSIFCLFLLSFASPMGCSNPQNSEAVGGADAGASPDGSGAACVGVNPDSAKAENWKPNTPASCKGKPASCVGTPMLDWKLKDFQPQSCGYEKVYGNRAFRGKVTVVVLLAAWCGFCQAQTEKLERMRLELASNCLLYTSPSPRDLSTSRMPSSA